MSSLPFENPNLSISGLQAELEHAHRLVRMSIREAKESRSLIQNLESEIEKQATIIGNQQEEILEWMHAAAAHKKMAEKFNPEGCTKSESMQNQLALCVLESAQSDGRFRHTALLAMALERLA